MYACFCCPEQNAEIYYLLVNMYDIRQIRKKKCYWKHINFNVDELEVNTN